MYRYSFDYNGSIYFVLADSKSEADGYASEHYGIDVDEISGYGSYNGNAVSEPSVDEFSDADSGL